MTTTMEMRPVGVDPIWVAVSASHVGILEIPGPQSAEVILRWAKDLSVDKIYKNDDLAWCALYFWRLMLACRLPVMTSKDPYDLLRARLVADYGQPLMTDLFGMIGVFSRPEGAHVGIILGDLGDRYLVRGGNQGNAVSEVPIEKKRLMARRWPPGVSMLDARPLPRLAANGAAVSVNEA